MAVNGDVSKRPFPAKVRGVFEMGCSGLGGQRVSVGCEAGCYICVRICVTAAQMSDSANYSSHLWKCSAVNIPIECR